MTLQPGLIHFRHRLWLRNGINVARSRSTPVSLCGSVANLAAFRRDGVCARGERAMSDFKGRHFEGESVLWAVRW